MTGLAEERIPFGASVLCRGYRVRLASPEIANGIARARPTYRGEQAVYEIGQHIAVDPIEGLGSRSLQAIADGPIMDPRSLFLPAGKISMDEYRERVAADVTVLPDLPRYGQKGPHNG